MSRPHKMSKSWPGGFGPYPHRMDPNAGGVYHSHRHRHRRTNDVLQNFKPSGAPSRLSTLLDRIGSVGGFGGERYWNRRHHHAIEPRAHIEGGLSLSGSLPSVSG